MNVEEPHAALSLFVTVAVYVSVEPAVADWDDGDSETVGLLREHTVAGPKEVDFVDSWLLTLSVE